MCALVLLCASGSIGPVDQPRNVDQEALEAADAGAGVLDADSLDELVEELLDDELLGSDEDDPPRESLR